MDRFREIDMHVFDNLFVCHATHDRSRERLRNAVCCMWLGSTFCFVFARVCTYAACLSNKYKLTLNKSLVELVLIDIAYLCTQTAVCSRLLSQYRFFLHFLIQCSAARRHQPPHRAQPLPRQERGRATGLAHTRAARTPCPRRTPRACLRATRFSR